MKKLLILFITSFLIQEVFSQEININEEIFIEWRNDKNSCDIRWHLRSEITERMKGSKLSPREVKKLLGKDYYSRSRHQNHITYSYLVSKCEEDGRRYNHIVIQFTFHKRKLKYIDEMIID